MDFGLRTQSQIVAKNFCLTYSVYLCLQGKYNGNSDEIDIGLQNRLSGLMKRIYKNSYFSLNEIL